MANFEAPARIPEKQKISIDIPKSREIFTGDINDAVIKVQQITGFEITPEWWTSEVGNEGSTEEILDRFDAAFERFVKKEMGVDDGSELSAKMNTPEQEVVSQEQILAEAEAEALHLEQVVAEHPEDQHLPEDFLDALAEHLKEKYFGVDDARNKILRSGSEQYREAERLRSEAEDPLTRIVESHYANHDGLEITVLGTSHTFDPQDPEIKYLDTLVRQKAENPRTVLILEGQYGKDGGLLEDPAEAVKTGGGEFNYMAALANQLGVEYIPAEPDAHDNAVNILAENPDLLRSEVALHYAIKTLAFIFKDQATMRIEDVAQYLYHSVGVAGDESEGGLVTRRISRQEVLSLSEQEKSQIIDEMPVVVSRLNDVFSRLYPGERLLELSEDDEITLLYDLNKQPVLWDPSAEDSMGNPTVIAEISQLDMLMRDRHTFRLIQEALSQGKEPVVAVGSSHVSTMTPALSAAFTPK